MLTLISSILGFYTLPQCESSSHEAQLRLPCWLQASASSRFCKPSAFRGIDIKQNVRCSYSAIAF